MAVVSFRTGRDSSPIGRNVSPSQEGELGRAPVDPWSLIILRIKRTLERLLKGLKASKALKFVTIFFPMSCLFAIIAETRRVWVSFRRFHLLELKIKNFGSLP